MNLHVNCTNYKQSKTMKSRTAILTFDKDCDGKLTESECINCLNSLGIFLNAKDQEKWLATLKFDNGYCDGEVLAETLEKLLKKSNPRTQLIEMFKKFDKSNTGTIDKQEFASVLSYIGELLTKQEQEALVNLASTGDRINYTELVNKLV